MKTKAHPPVGIQSSLGIKLLALLSGCLWIAVFGGTSLAAQAPAGTRHVRTLAFDSILIRPTAPGAAQVPASSNVPIGADDAFRNTDGVFAANNMPLVTLIQFAYKTGTGQRESLHRQLPDWALTQGFTMQAVTSDHAVTKDQMRVMMRAMLTDRFKLAVHNETRETQVLQVVLDKPEGLGPQLRRHLSDAPCSSMAPALDHPVSTHPVSAQLVSQVHPDANDHPESKPIAAPTTVPGGFPALCGSFVRMKPDTPGLRREGARDMQMATTVTAFSLLGNLGVPVVDQTGLSGSFDWVLQFKPDPQPDQKTPSAASGPTFQQALKEQLGLTLKPQTAPYEFLIIDHLERASD